MKKRVICLILTISSVFSVLSFGLSACAAETDVKVYEEIILAYEIIGRRDCSLEINGINAICNANLKSQKSAKLSIKMELQKKKSDGYDTVKTWTASKTGTSLTLEEKRAINLLSSYRLKVTFTAGGETATAYSYPK